MILKIKPTVTKLINLSRVHKSILMLLNDLFMLTLAYLFSIFLREDILILLDFANLFVQNLGIIFILSIPIFIFFGLYNSQVRFMGFNAMLNIIYACTTLVLISYLASYSFRELIYEFNNFLLIKFNLIFLLVLTFLIIGSRQTARWIINSSESGFAKRDFIVYGAGTAGRSAVSTLIANQESKILGYIDDNKDIHGMYINNFPVLGGIDYVTNVIKNNKNLSVLLAAPSMSSNRRREVLKKLEESTISVRSLPPLNEIVIGIKNAYKIENLRPEELLGRDPIILDSKKIQSSIENKVILITGAGGSIGSELSRQIFKLKPTRMILIDHSEINLFNIHNELQEYLHNANLDVDIVPKLGSVLDLEFLKKIFTEHKIDSIYHAAAYKHVALVEQNIIQGIKNNVMGTFNIVTLAEQNKIDSLIHISTDKAVRPTNFMGASKRIAELIIQGIVKDSIKNLRYTMVRFGNVLGSSGSVIPLFKKQIESGGPVTVTDKEVTRFFMTVSEASQLVIEAGTQALGGEVFVLDMGDPIKINELAKRMIRLSGFSVSDDESDQHGIAIKYIGLRPGEKLYEELILGNDLQKTDNHKVFKANEEHLNWHQVKEMINKFNIAILNNDSEEVKKLMLDYVTDYVPSKKYS